MGNICSHLQKVGSPGYNNGGILDGSDEGVHLGSPCNPLQWWLTDDHLGHGSALRVEDYTGVPAGTCWTVGSAVGLYLWGRPNDGSQGLPPQGQQHWEYLKLI